MDGDVKLGDRDLFGTLDFLAMNSITAVAVPSKNL